MSALAYRHQRVQRLRRLVSRRSARQEEGRFVIEGANLLEEALLAGVPVEALYVDVAWDRSSARAERLQTLLDRCYAAGTRIFELDEGVLARVAGTVTPQPVLAVVPMPVPSLTDIGARGPSLVVVCADVRDPGNAGTVARSAWAAGADALVCCEGTVDMWNPKAVRSSAGAVLHLPIVAAPAPRATLEAIGGWGLRRWGTVAVGGEYYADADLAQPCAIVVGNEASGLPVAEMSAALDGLVTIPMAGGAESLNVGMATAVLCFEVARQRRSRGEGPRGGERRLLAATGTT
ncbi:MAG TPA: RNA methyltransferase [Acidimicrobiales bacterium]|nr:RNA methyltransferase [Acidimicrobiales bacterium]